WLGAKAVPDKIIFRGDNAVRLAFIFSQAPDEIEHQSCIRCRGSTNGKHSLEVTAKDAKGAKA
ncbi:MAG: hypothetical protein JWN42_1944, partial [Candidatus Angelobacter sp.]|nr:hypothetical protein [Candidatus Angelobacter sp.]